MKKMWSIGFYVSPKFIIIRNYFGKIRGHIKKKKKEDTDKNKTNIFLFIFNPFFCISEKACSFKRY